MRVTTHNGRSGKSGVFSPKHNDRDFDISKSDHIDTSKSAKNYTAHCGKAGQSFDDAERDFYEKTFGDYLKDRNARALKARHSERVIDVDVYRKSQKSCPEETILQIGKKGDTARAKVLFDVVKRQLAWEQRTFPQRKILDVAIHVDEQGAPHAHVRAVWIGHDKDGRACVNQSKALSEMGVKAPDISKPIDRYNNAKTTFTKACRDHFIGLCKERGLELETEPLERSRTGLSLEEYKARQEAQKALKARQEVEKAQKAMTTLQTKIETLRDEYEDMTRMEKMERFMDSVKYSDGRSVLDVFESCENSLLRDDYER